GQFWYKQYADIGSFDPSTPLREWTPAERDALLYGGDAAARLGSRPPKTPPPPPQRPHLVAECLELARQPRDQHRINSCTHA
ncbi:hypothetical protein, partial [Nocardia cyriacigeorgica]|uniref:hypothetical protein n=1 Tax=Nocardia cyriacigeorgica TaxID=135487 RepID=UPI002456785C